MVDGPKKYAHLCFLFLAPLIFTKLHIRVLLALLESDQLGMMKHKLSLFKIHTLMNICDFAQTLTKCCIETIHIVWSSINHLVNLCILGQLFWNPSNSLVGVVPSFAFNLLNKTMVIKMVLRFLYQFNICSSSQLPFSSCLQWTLM